MTMYFVGIDISKYKHDCCIISAANQKVVSPPFVFLIFLHLYTMDTHRLSDVTGLFSGIYMVFMLSPSVIPPSLNVSTRT